MEHSFGEWMRGRVSGCRIRQRGGELGGIRNGWGGKLEGGWTGDQY